MAKKIQKFLNRFGIVKKILFLCSSFLILTVIHCDRRYYRRPLLFPPPNSNPIPSPYPDSIGGQCQFYKVQSLIINCQEKHNFFSLKVQQQQDIVMSSCANEAFTAVWGPGAGHTAQYIYTSLLNAFKNSLDAGQLNTCLGGNYPFNGPLIIDTAIDMIGLNMLEPETFIKCYREQLELYREKYACTILTSPQETSSQYP